VHRRLANAPSAQLFGNAAREHTERYGTTPEQLAAVASERFVREHGLEDQAVEIVAQGVDDRHGWFLRVQHNLGLGGACVATVYRGGTLR
jgi:hypothetical protein